MESITHQDMIRELLSKTGLSQKKLGGLINLSQPTISRISKGQEMDSRKICNAVEVAYKKYITAPKKSTAASIEAA